MRNSSVTKFLLNGVAKFHFVSLCVRLSKSSSGTSTENNHMG
jgi:hypothetical protein